MGRQSYIQKSLQACEKLGGIKQFWDNAATHGDICPHINDLIEF